MARVDRHRSCDVMHGCRAGVTELPCIWRDGCCNAQLLASMIVVESTPGRTRRIGYNPLPCMILIRIGYPTSTTVSWRVKTERTEPFSASRFERAIIRYMIRLTEPHSRRAYICWPGKMGRDAFRGVERGRLDTARSIGNPQC